MVVYCFCSSVSSSEILFLKRSRCAVTIGRMPAPGLGSPPPRRESKARGECDVEVSKPDMMEEVGDVLPPRLPAAYDDLG